MDKWAAASLLDVDPGAGPRQVERAFRREAREHHPDRFPPGSEAWEDASYRLRALVQAREVLLAPPPAVRRAPEGDGTWAWSDQAPEPRPDASRFPSARDLDRRMRLWGFGWGGFLVLSGVVSYAVGATQPTNDAMPVWSPALVITGLVVVTIGLRAHRRLTR